MTSVNVATTQNTVTVTEGDASVVTVTTTGPQGAQGEGSATVTIGTTTTGSAGSSAAVTNTGSATAAVLNFTIPAGAAGAAGADGAAGTNGTNGTDGVDGTDGNDGAPGPQGPAGAAGAAGANGGTDIVLDTTPQLGGDLDMNSKYISSGTLGVKNTGTQSELQLYCEVSNQHYAAIKAPAHADFSGNLTFTLPSGYGSANQVLTTDGSGGTSWAAASGGMSRAQTTAVALIFS